MLNYLIGKGADLNFQDKIGYSALHFASQNNHVGITEILINNGAELNIKDVYGNPPIWTAIFNAKENFSIVKMLLVKDVDITSKNHYGKSPKDIWFLKYNTDIEDLLK